jgi:SAM-dependent methyltransferase
MPTKWDERYQRGEAADKEPEPLLGEAAAAAVRGEALDLACGTGRHTLWLARERWRVTAVDSSVFAIHSLTERAGGLPVRTIQADLEQDEFRIEADRYNLIVDTCFLHRPLFPAIREALCPGGVFFGIFPLEGLNPAYLIQKDELPRYFDGWEFQRRCDRAPS